MVDGRIILDDALATTSRVNFHDFNFECRRKGNVHMGRFELQTHHLGGLMLLLHIVDSN